MLLQSDEDLFGESKAKVDTRNDFDDEGEEDDGERALKDEKANTAKVKATEIKLFLVAFLCSF